MYYDGAYAPFGEPYSETGTSDRSFTGQDQDTVTGLYDFLYREHSPVQGRWISPDPAGLAAAGLSNPQSLNRYVYAMNNPLKYVDPDGTTTDGCYFCPWAPSPGVGVFQGPQPSGVGGVGIGNGGCDQFCMMDPNDPGHVPWFNNNWSPWDAEIVELNGPSPNEACEAKLLNMANQELGTNFTHSNVVNFYNNGRAYNIVIQSSQLTPAQFNNIQLGRYTTYGMQWLFGAGLSGHIADETNLGFPQSAFLSENVGGNLSVQFAFHDDHGFAYNPIGALIHLITDILGHNTRQPC